jgi:WD40 repeat protein
VVDGVASPAYYSASDLEQAPDGRVAYVGVTKTTDQSGELVVGGTSTSNPATFNITKPGSASRLGFDIRHVAFSPDGKGFAFVKRLYPNPGVQVIANGKPVGPTYQQANQLQWSPDGSILFFVAGSPTGTFPVVNGTELGPVGSADEISFSPDGKHYAFQVYLGTPKVVVDGKDQLKANGYVRESLRWSPDSKHVVYGAQNNLSRYEIVKDGVTQPGILLTFLAMNRVQPQITFPPIAFSPDGSRMAWVGMKDATSRQSLAVDGVYYPAPTPNFMFPSFSPDSKHFAALMTGNAGWSIMVDGKVSPAYEDIVPAGTAAFRFADAHTYRFYAVKAGQIYRVTIDLP